MEAGARAHLDGCETCQANLAEWESSGRLFHGIFDDSSSGPLEDCPTDCPPLENLLRLASSSNPETDAAVLEHVTCCEACGAILRDATLAKELKTASPQWQKKFARSVATPARSNRIAVWIAVAASVAIGAAGVSWWIFSGSTHPEALLAKAYTAHRPFEYRLPDAGYSAQDARRGSGGSTFDKRPELARAEDEIRSRLAAHPDDAGALALKGMAELQGG
jgi:hypothetical protein